MRRGRKPAKSKEAKLPVARKAPKDNAMVRDLEKRLAEALRDKAEALDQQTATSEILRVISQSSTDVQPVFEAIGSSAWRLLGGFGGAVYRVVDEDLHLAAYISTNSTGDAALRSRYPRPLDVFSPPGEAIRRRAPVVLTDIDTDGWVPDDSRDVIRKRGVRSGVWVPMMKEGVTLGAIGVTRSEPGSFRVEQITLLQTFADQAVIAIENVRLFNETKEALERQTATADILRVISSSPTDIHPVLEAVVESAARLCAAEDVSVFEEDAGAFRVAAFRGTDLSSFDGTPVSRDSVTGRSMLDRQLVHVHDILQETQFPISQAYARQSGNRTMLAVPLLREGTAIG